MSVLTALNPRRFLLPALAMLVVALLAGAAGYLTAGSGRERVEPAVAVEPAFLRGVVQSVSQDRLALTTDAGPMELRLDTQLAVEALRPTTFDRIASGEWLNAGAISHAQTLFALVGIVVIPPGQLEPPR